MTPLSIPSARALPGVGGDHRRRRHGRNVRGTAVVHIWVLIRKLGLGIMSIDRHPASRPLRAAVNSGSIRSDRLAGLVLGAALVAMGLVAGIFFDWAASIMPALAQADNRTYVVVMQNAITTMNNSPVFLFTLMGAFVFTGAAAIVQHRVGARAAVRWTLAAFALYVIAIAITVAVHFPLNDTLESAGDPDSIATIGALRRDTEALWANAHIARTLVTIAAFASLCRALWLRRR